MAPKYESRNGIILKDGHTMHTQDIVKDLNRKSYLEGVVKQRDELMQALNLILSSENNILSDMDFCREGNSDDVKWKFDEAKELIKNIET